ncbi:hypothetical protein [Nocardioides panzhihuensis]|uniref:Uncharacterized protein n=1 Tax=Nocardioides panzhihuensis TaxID=860243 RepID=A0A7Z0DNM2_9ACTN|nr:hypothetical protein [Nocardioides panzhihuensis]NYI78541.1 hypothetical protein [Nocardioides panzhihuensis]
MDEQFEAELERRLCLIDDPSTEEGPLPRLPLSDVVLSVVGLVVLSVALLLWCL